MKLDIAMSFRVGRTVIPILLVGLTAFSALCAPPTFAQEGSVVALPSSPMPKGPARRNEMWQALMLPVSVRLNNATVKEMAEAVSKVSKLPIRVDDSVPDTVRITLEAHRIPLANLLEAMARRADLLIARDKDQKGVLLTRPPMLKVDDTEQPIGRDGTFPWAEEWGIPPSAVVSLSAGRSGGPVGSGNFGFASTPPLQSATTTYAPEGGGLPGYGGPYTPVPSAANSQPQNLTYTSLGDSLLVVSEPGRGEKGEAGVWLTVYRIEKSGSIGKVGTLFHAYRETPPAISLPLGGAPEAAPGTATPLLISPSADPAPAPSPAPNAAP